MPGAQVIRQADRGAVCRTQIAQICAGSTAKSSLFGTVQNGGSRAGATTSDRDLRDWRFKARALPAGYSRLAAFGCLGHTRHKSASSGIPGWNRLFGRARSDSLVRVPADRKYSGCLAVTGGSR